MLQRHVSYLWTTSQNLDEKQAVVLGPGKGSCPEDLPLTDDELRGTSKRPGRIKEGVDG